LARRALKLLAIAVLAGLIAQLVGDSVGWTVAVLGIYLAGVGAYVLVQRGRERRRDDATH
jgi:hypothetical protein